MWPVSFYRKKIDKEINKKCMRNMFIVVLFVYSLILYHLVVSENLLLLLCVQEPNAQQNSFIDLVCITACKFIFTE